METVMFAFAWALMLGALTIFGSWALVLLGYFIWDVLRYFLFPKG